MITSPTRTTFDPARILGVPAAEAVALLAGKVVTPGEVEAVAARTYQWRKHQRDPDSYWVTVSQAARLLRVSPVVVTRLLAEERLPYVTHVSGVRLMRRHEIEERARARAR